MASGLSQMSLLGWYCSSLHVPLISEIKKSDTLSDAGVVLLHAAGRGRSVVRKRFDIEANKPMQKTIPLHVWVKEEADGMLGRLVKWWRHRCPKTGLLKSTSQRITKELRPDIIALVQSRLEQGR